MTRAPFNVRWCLVVVVAIAGCGGARQVPRAPTGQVRATVLVQPALADPAEALEQERPDVRTVVVTPRDDQKIREARDLLDHAWESYVAMEFEAGLETIREAVVLLESSARTQADFDALAEAILVRGMAELALGLDDQARQSLLAAARLRPDLELDEGRYPPPVRELYADVREQLRAEPASSLTLATRPAGARLFLDGQGQGAAPQTLYATSGRHQLRVEAPGFASRTLTVTFAPEGGQMEVELPHADAVAAGRQMLEAEEPAGDEARAAWRETFGTDAVVLAVPSEQGVSGTWVDLGSGATAEASAPDLGELVSQLEQSAPEPANGEENTTAHRNEGLFARALLGFLLRADDLRQDDPELKVEGGSLAADLELSVGGSLAPGVVFGGTLVLTLGGPAYAIEGEPDSKPRVGSLGALGVFIAWYPTGEGGWNIYGSVGAASGKLVDGDSAVVQAAQLGGALLSVGGGYEWWIADEWGLGVFLRLVGYRLTNGSGSNLSAGGLSLAGTLTFN